VNLKIEQGVTDLIDISELLFIRLKIVDKTNCYKQQLKISWGNISLSSPQ
jgi:hypothetical protein